MRTSRERAEAMTRIFRSDQGCWIQICLGDDFESGCLAHRSVLDPELELEKLRTKLTNEFEDAYHDGIWTGESRNLKIEDQNEQET